MMAVTELRKPTFPASWTSVGTSTRLRLVMERPTPSLPPKFAPQVQTVPSDLRTTVPRAPPQMDTTSAPNAVKGNAKVSIPRTACALRFIGGCILSARSRISHFSFSQRRNGPGHDPAQVFDRMNKMNRIERSGAGADNMGGPCFVAALIEGRHGGRPALVPLNPVILSSQFSFQGAVEDGAIALIIAIHAISISVVKDSGLISWRPF